METNRDPSTNGFSLKNIIFCCCLRSDGTAVHEDLTTLKLETDKSDIESPKLENDLEEQNKIEENNVDNGNGNEKSEVSAVPAVFVEEKQNGNNNPIEQTDPSDVDNSQIPNDISGDLCFREENLMEEFDNISEIDLMNIPKQEKKKTAEIRIRIHLDTEKSTLLITVVDAYDLARPSSTTNSIRELIIEDVPPVLAYSVHVSVLPMKKQRFKTKMRQGPDPYFDEIIKITKAYIDEIRKWRLRFRLYGSMRNAMIQVIGEGFLPLDMIDLGQRMQCKLALLIHGPGEEPDNTLMFASQCKYDSMTSLESIDKMISEIDTSTTPELLVGLSYNSNTGRLTVEMVKGSKFPKLKDTKLPDTFVTLSVKSLKGEELGSAKTNIKKGSCEPVFEEVFVFQVFVYQLDEIQLTFTGYNKQKMGKKSIFGSFTIGNQGTSEEEMHHWKDLAAAAIGDQILRWHTFILPHKNSKAMQI